MGCDEVKLLKDSEILVVKHDIMKTMFYTS